MYRVPCACMCAGGCACVGVCALTSCVWIFICIYAICLFASWKIQCIQCNAKRALPLSLSLSLWIYPSLSLSLLHCTYFSLFGSNIFLFGFLLFEAINRNIFLFGFQYAPPLQMFDSVFCNRILDIHIYLGIYVSGYIQIYIEYKDFKWDCFNSAFSDLFAFWTWMAARRLIWKNSRSASWTRDLIWTNPRLRVCTVGKCISKFPQNI